MPTAPTSPPELLHLIRRSGVIEETTLEKFLAAHPENTLPTAPKELARLLVQEQLLTIFQATQLLAGRYKGFFLGKYKLLDRIGAGGMGSVYLAEHRTMKRRVAVKVLPPERTSSPGQRERFYREARAAAALDHPNIVRAYDILEESGIHFIVMEHIVGVSLQKYVTDNGMLPVPHALDFIRQAAFGLQHIHDAGLIHRDIKPSNLLLDRTGTLKILDLGLARFQKNEHPDDELTREHDKSHVLGTADFLAPEQAIDSHKVDHRADIYSLGATLYFLLAARPPFAEASLMQKLVCHQMREPPPLTGFRTDLDPMVIELVTKMMAKKPDQRFQSATELIAELGKFSMASVSLDSIILTKLNPNETPPASKILSGTWAKPTGSGTSGIISQVIPKDATATSTSGRLLMSGRLGSGSTKGPQTISYDLSDRFTGDEGAGEGDGSGILLVRRFKEEQPGSPLARSITLLLGCLLGAAGIYGMSELADEDLEIRAQHIREFAGKSDELGEPIVKHVGNTTGSGSPAQQGPKSTPKPWPPKQPPKIGPFVSIHPILSRELRGHQGVVERLIVSPNRLYLASADEVGNVILWDEASGNPIRQIKAHLGPVYGLSFSPDGARLATCGKDGFVRVWSSQDGQKIAELSDGPPTDLRSVAFLPDGKRLVSGGDDKIGRLWDIENARVLRRFEGHLNSISAVAVSPDGTQVFTGSFDATIKAWNVESGALLQTLNGHNGPVGTIAISPDGTRLVSGGHDATVRLWKISDGSHVKVEVKRGQVFWCAFSADGRFFSASGRVRNVRIYDTKAGMLRELISLPENATMVSGNGFTPEGKYFYTASSDSIVRRWELPAYVRSLVPDLRYLQLGQGLTSATVTLNGKYLVLAGPERKLRVIDRSTGLVKHTRETAQPVNDILPFLDGRRVLLLGANGRVSVWDAEDGKLINRPGDHNGSIRTGAIARNGLFAATLGTDNQVRIWDIAAGKPKHAVDCRTDQGSDTPQLRFVNNDASVAVVSPNGINYYSVESGLHERTIELREFRPMGMSPDGVTVYGTNAKHELVLFDAGNQKIVRVLGGHTEAIRQVVVSDNGEWLISRADDRSIRIWHVYSGRPAAVLELPTDEKAWLATTASGQHVLITDVVGRLLLLECLGIQNSFFQGLTP